jgi:hypothetical protein
VLYSIFSTALDLYQIVEFPGLDAENEGPQFLDGTLEHGTTRMLGVAQNDYFVPLCDLNTFPALA